MGNSPIKTEVVLDLKRVTAEVAARHGMLVRQDDPAMLLVTMNEVVLQQVVGSLEARTEKIVAGMEAGLRSAQRQAMGSIEKKARKAGIAVREEIQKDVDAGGATRERADCRTESRLFAIRRAPLGCCRRDSRKRTSGVGCWFGSISC